MARRKITVFYAWQSDRPQNINRHFIRKALNEAARRITEDASIDAEVVIDADTEGVAGTPPVTETILRKIAGADIFVPDLTFVAQTDDGKLIPNPNVMIEYGYALHALTFTAMMPVMNTQFGGPGALPFDMRHVRHPTQYSVAPDASDGPRRMLRNKLSDDLENILRPMVRHILQQPRTGAAFVPVAPTRPPAFFFQPQDVLINFGYPGEQEMRFKRDRAIYIRLYPIYRDQPRVGRARAAEVVNKLQPPAPIQSSLNNRNGWGAIAVEPHGDGITSFSQIFDTGELWGASEKPFWREQQDVIAAIGVEKALVAALENYRVVYQRELQFRPPFRVEFGATGLKNCWLLVPSLDFPSSAEHAGPILQDAISCQYELTNFQRDEWRSALRSFLIDFYDLAGSERATVLTDQHVADNGLPPR